MECCWVSFRGFCGVFKGCVDGWVRLLGENEEEEILLKEDWIEGFFKMSGWGELSSRTKKEILIREGEKAGEVVSVDKECEIYKLR